MHDVTLNNLAGGAVGVLFDKELQRVLENIQDLHTDPEASRSITLKVTIKPNKERDAADSKVEVTSKLAAAVPRGTPLFLGTVEDERGERKHVARQVDVAQQHFGFAVPEHEEAAE